MEAFLKLSLVLLLRFFSNPNFVVFFAHFGSTLTSTIVTHLTSPISRIITIQSSPDKAEKEDEEVATLTREEAASGLAIGSATDSGVNLYILAGHEAMQL